MNWIRFFSFFFFIPKPFFFPRPILLRCIQHLDYVSTKKKLKKKCSQSVLNQDPSCVDQKHCLPNASTHSGYGSGSSMLIYSSQSHNRVVLWLISKWKKKNHSAGWLFRWQGCQPDVINLATAQHHSSISAHHPSHCFQHNVADYAKPRKWHFSKLSYHLHVIKF